MSNLTTLPKGDSAWLLRKSIQRIMQQVSVLETNIGSSTTGNSSDTQIIFNDAGTLRGDSGLTYNKTTDLLSVGSATITGDLTVDTNTLKVTASTDTVTVGATTTDAKFRVVDASYNGLRIGFLPGTANYNLYDATVHEFRTASVTPQQLYTLQASSSVWYDGAGGTRMTLNSTGLGVGVSPSYKIHTNGVIATTNTFGAFTALQSAGGTGYRWTLANDNNFYLAYSPDGFSSTSTNRISLDSSGNVGIGVTPVTSHILSCAGPIGISGTNSGTRTSYIANSGACSIYYTDGGGSGFFADFGNLIIQPRTSAARSVVIATGSTTPVERAVVKSTGQVRFVPLAADPSGAEAGDVYYNSVSNRLKYYNGTAWTLI